MRKRAEEIVNLVQKAEREITLNDEAIAGDIHIRRGRNRCHSPPCKGSRTKYSRSTTNPYHISSGIPRTVTEELDKGLIDFGLLFDPKDLSKYQYLRIPQKDTWGGVNAPRCAIGQERGHRPKGFMG